MKNYVAKGNVIDYAAGGAVVSGTPVVIGEIVAIPTISGGNGDTIPCEVEGIYQLTKLAGEAWTQGAKIYWDAGNSRCTTTASTHKQVGNASVAAQSADTTGYVRLGKL